MLKLKGGTMGEIFNRVSYSNQNEKLEKHEPLWKNLKENEY